MVMRLRPKLLQKLWVLVVLGAMFYIGSDEGYLVAVEAAASFVPQHHQQQRHHHQYWNRHDPKSCRPLLSSRQQQPTTTRPRTVALFSSASSSSSSSTPTRSTAEITTAAAVVNSRPLLGHPICDYHQVTIPCNDDGPPRQAIAVQDLTPVIQQRLEESGMQQGVVNVISRHTTTAITINERESRLARDMEEFFLSMVPPDERSESVRAKVGVRYQHNDIDQRPESDEEAQRCRDNGWDIDNHEQLQAWRAQEPINAHSHLLSMLLGSSESIPVVDGKMVIGQWQSILLVDLDGPRDRTVGIQFLGYGASSAGDGTRTDP
ncbi:hypothetical protein ACA910_021296 [Epithemia clementina (nom. ined.)]